MTTNVACASCTICCRDQLIILMPEDAPNMAAFDVEAVEFKGETFHLLNKKPNGDCVHLGSTGCTIYDQRPMVCREYDCRKQFKIMPRNDRRRFKNQQIWAEARRRLPTLDAEDLAELDAYRARASSAFEQLQSRIPK